MLFLPKFKSIYIMDPNFDDYEGLQTGKRLRNVIRCFYKRAEEIIYHLNAQKWQVYYGGGGNTEEGICITVSSWYLRHLVNIDLATPECLLNAFIFTKVTM
ncbi:hypothetical protein PVAND_003616 [Polypedilum vanderplanki]|nr:hypothetical protein PVAND_003616 [Polypedilum vanderplanki]